MTSAAPSPVLILMGSSRGDGDTRAAAGRLCDALGPDAAQLIDLAAMRLRPFDYGTVAEDDGLRALVRRIADHHHLVLATPVYWYAMSTPMKIFFDRLTDLLMDPRGKPVGRALAGRNVWLLSLGTDDDLPLGFEEPFRRTAAYFDMVWRGSCYVQSTQECRHTEEARARIQSFAAMIRACG